MSEFFDNIEVYKKAKRGTYIIVPLNKEQTHKIDTNNNNNEIQITQETNIKADDLTEEFVKKCNNGFLEKRKFNVNALFNDEMKKDSIIYNVKEVIFFKFDNGIGFLSLLYLYDNKYTMDFYDSVQPGYTKDEQETGNNFLTKIVAYLMGSPNNLKKISINDTYLFNFAYVNKRFENLETLDQVTSNAHKIIDLSRNFEDKSERDIKFVYGARDVKVATYRWGCCISSQSISYVYADENMKELESLPSGDIAIAEDDLLITILALHQKYTCIYFNDALYNLMVDKNNKIALRINKNVKNLKREAIEFRAYGTVTPARISRWDNVCRTYEYLLDVNDVNKTFDEIEAKINVLNEMQEKIVQDNQSILAGIITVFGLISIVASILAIISEVKSGGSDVITGLILSTVGIVLLPVALYLFLFTRRK